MKTEAKALSARCDEIFLYVTLSDGRIIATPIDWYPRLLRATPRQRANYEISAAGHGIHWPDVDEDLSVEGMLSGRRAVDAPDGGV